MPDPTTPPSHPLLIAEIQRLDSELARVRAGLAVIEEDAASYALRARRMMPEAFILKLVAGWFEELALAARIARNEP